ncbi:MAG: aminomethyltransferase family protein, partial [Alphaproteobacteria bacterium]
ANRLPKALGRVGLCHALNTKGGVHSEFTVIREAEESYYLVSAGAYQRLDHDWLTKHMPDDGSVQFQNLTNTVGVLVVSGPKARDLMGRITDADLSSAAFPWLTSQEILVGQASARAARVNFVGELGWELHHPMECQNHIFDAIMEAGADLGLKPFGIRAMDMLRIEKSYRMVGTELSIEYSAFESGLQRFVHPNKGSFIGRDALVEWQQNGFANEMVTMAVSDIIDADPLGNNPIFEDGKMVGRATSGNYGPRLDTSFVMAMVPPSLAAEGTELEMDILGTRHKVTVVGESPYDPDNEKLRA